MLVFRICKNKYASKLEASGKGNRWNTEGKFVIYSAGSLSLACLENVVHTSGEILYNNDYSNLYIHVSEAIEIITVSLQDLPDNWRNENQRSLTQKKGDAWYNEKLSLLLQIPSAIIPREINYLINTKHPDFSKIFIEKTEPFLFDRKIKQAL